MKYQVVVGNIGTVYDGNSYLSACVHYSDYVTLSGKLHGRAAGEPVALFEDGHPIREHQPPTPPC